MDPAGDGAMAAARAARDGLLVITAAGAAARTTGAAREVGGASERSMDAGVGVPETAAAGGESASHVGPVRLAPPLRPCGVGAATAPAPAELALDRGGEVAARGSGWGGASAAVGPASESERTDTNDELPVSPTVVSSAGLVNEKGRADTTVGGKVAGRPYRGREQRALTCLAGCARLWPTTRRAAASALGDLKRS